MAEPPGGRELRVVINRARLEAIEAGSRDVRAEHLLLALIDDPADGRRRESRVGPVLAALGLDRERLLEGLSLERAHSLAAAGFASLPDERLTATRLPSTPSLGSSARDALVAGHRALVRERMVEQRAAHRRRAHRGRADSEADGVAAPPRRSPGHRPDIGEFALALGVLSAELGTIPRALLLIGLSRDALLGAVRAAALEG